MNIYCIFIGVGVGVGIGISVSVIIYLIYFLQIVLRNMITYNNIVILFFVFKLNLEGVV